MTNIKLNVTAVYMQSIEITLKNHGINLTKREIVEYCAYSRRIYFSESFWVNKITWVFDILERYKYKHRFDGKRLRSVDAKEIWAITAEALGMTLNYDGAFMDCELPSLKNAVIELFEHLYMSYVNNVKEYIKFAYDFGFTDLQSLMDKFRVSHSICDSLIKKIEEDEIRVNENGPNCRFYDLFRKDNKGLKKYVEFIKEMYPAN